MGDVGAGAGLVPPSIHQDRDYTPRARRAGIAAGPSTDRDPPCSHAHPTIGEHGQPRIRSDIVAGMIADKGSIGWLPPGMLLDYRGNGPGYAVPDKSRVYLLFEQKLQSLLLSKLNGNEGY